MNRSEKEKKMELLVIVLHKPEYLDDLLSIIAELDISHTTIIDSQGMAEVLARDVPIFAGLRKILTETGPHNKTIFGLARNRDAVSELRKILREEGIDFTNSDMGVIFTLPVDIVEGC